MGMERNGKHHWVYIISVSGRTKCLSSLFIPRGSGIKGSGRLGTIARQSRQDCSCCSKSNSLKSLTVQFVQCVETLYPRMPQLSPSSPIATKRRRFQYLSPDTLSVRLNPSIPRPILDS